MLKLNSSKFAGPLRLLCLGLLVGVTSACGPDATPTAPTTPTTPGAGPPTGPAPDAVLNHRYFSFSAPFAIRGFSPMRFDGSGSRGEGLSYFIEFGDGQVSTEPVAVHPIEERGQYTARLTVVDRFGRVDAEAATVHVATLSLLINPYESWNVPSARMGLDFTSQRGADVSGSFYDESATPRTSRFTGTLGGEHDIRLVLEGSGVVLSGTLQLQGSYSGWRLNLTYGSGERTGRQLTFFFDDGPG